MATETVRSDDLILLNAFVDGALSPAERAAVAQRLASDPDFARAHLTLARIKASVAASADEAPEIALPPRRRRIPPAVFAAAAAAVGCVAVLASADVVLQRDTSRPEPAPAAAVALANLPSRPLLPHLEIAGLSLVTISMDTTGPPLAVVATYRGPHGCRLDLRAGPARRGVTAAAGPNRRMWTVGDLHYDLVAHGMPPWRFTIIAEAAENQTRSDRLPRALEQRLREARAAAPPCAG